LDASFFPENGTEPALAAEPVAAGVTGALVAAAGLPAASPFLASVLEAAAAGA